VPESAPDFLHLLRALAAHQVEHIVVGGLCAVLHGAPITTFDLDVVHARDEVNLDRLIEALTKLVAYYRTGEDRRLSPERRHLASPGHHLLLTTEGPLDLLGTIGSGRDYSALLPHTEEIVLDDLHVRILDLETLIAVKEETGREKDRMILPMLRQVLEERRKS
jgi:hypothetical protein